jgi:hypothetical protein
MLQALSHPDAFGIVNRLGLAQKASGLFPALSFRAMFDLQLNFRTYRT